MAIKVPPELDPAERAEIERLFALVGTDDLSLEQMWRCMDTIWDEYGCDNSKPHQKKIAQFYTHPVWLLNGLFIEHHALSMQHRRDVSNWVASRSVRRIAEFGGGYGTLARLIATQCPSVEIEIVEPFPHPLAIKRSKQFTNLRYTRELAGMFDLIIAMDVFEHVEDPLGLIRKTAVHLRPGGLYLTANCFRPVIKCHLPRTFHFERSWPAVMRALGMVYVEDVVYGSAFRKEGNGSVLVARLVEARSRLAFNSLRWSEALTPHLGLKTGLRKTLARLAR